MPSPITLADHEVVLYVPDLHQVRHFRCGRPTLDAWLRSAAKQHQALSLTRTSVLVPRQTPPEGRKPILGYYSLAAHATALDDLPPDKAAALPRHPLGSVLLARLAIDEQYQGQGLGTMLLAYIARDTLRAADSVGVHLLVVDALDQAARSWYLRQGFISAISTPMRLFLPIPHLAEIWPDGRGTRQ